MLCVLFMDFTGYLLPWDTLSVVATAVGTGLPHDIPLLGLAFGIFAAMPLLDRKGRGPVWKGIVWATVVTCVVLTVYALLRSTPNTEATAEVAAHVAAQRLRVLGFLLPFWSLVVTMTWIMTRQIRLYDRITIAVR